MLPPGVLLGIYAFLLGFAVFLGLITLAPESSVPDSSDRAFMALGAGVFTALAAFAHGFL